MNLRPLLLPPIVLTALWAGAVWWPNQSSVASEQARLAAAQSEQLALVASFDELNAAADRLGAFDTDLARFDVAVPSTLGMATVLRSIHVEAAATELQVELLSPSDVLGGTTVDNDRPVPPGMASVSMMLEGRGTFEQVMAFTDRLRNLPRLVVIDTMGLSAVDGDAAQIILDLEFRVFTTEALVGVAAGAFVPVETESSFEDESIDLGPEQQDVLARVEELEGTP